MTLFFLKVDPGQQVIASLFGVSQSTVSRITKETILLLEEMVEPFWDGPHVIDDRDRLPPFKKDAIFSEVTLVADTTLVLIEQPKHPDAQKATYSNYITHHAAKALVAIGPDGHVCFVSRAYGANASDDDIAQASKFFDRVTPGALVLFDKGAGSKLEEGIKAKGGTLTTPAFVVRNGMTFMEWKLSDQVASA